MDVRDGLARVIATGLDSSQAETDFAFLVGGSDPTDADLEIADLILERYEVTPKRGSVSNAD